MKRKSNLPPGTLPSYVRLKDGEMLITGHNVAITREQMSLMIIEAGIEGELKEQMHKSGILPLQENDLTLIAINMADVMCEAHRNGTDLEAAFLEAGILPQNPEPPSRTAFTTVK